MNNDDDESSAANGDYSFQIGDGGGQSDLIGDNKLAHHVVHRKKKVREFPVPSRDVTTKLSLGGNNDVITELFLPRGSLVSGIRAGDGKLVSLFLRCSCGLIPCPAS
jgi:hypothetical protein